MGSTPRKSLQERLSAMRLPAVAAQVGPGSAREACHDHRHAQGRGGSSARSVGCQAGAGAGSNSGEAGEIARTSGENPAGQRDRQRPQLVLLAQRAAVDVQRALQGEARGCFERWMAEVSRLDTLRFHCNGRARSRDWLSRLLICLRSTTSNITRGGA